MTLCLAGRASLPINIVGTVYSCMTTVLFLLPPTLPANAGNMNYGAVAFVLLLYLAGSIWLAHGKENYCGPAAVRYDSIHNDEHGEEDNED
jgi:hypothetical protein